MASTAARQKNNITRPMKIHIPDFCYRPLKPSERLERPEYYVRFIEINIFLNSVILFVKISTAKKGKKKQTENYHNDQW